MLTTDRDQVLLERLNRHPQMRARVESLLAVVEDAAGDCERADAAERRMIEELRADGSRGADGMGGTRGGEADAAGDRRAGLGGRGGKKNCIGTRPSV